MAYRSITSGSNGGVHITINKPAGVANGDVLVGAAFWTTTAGTNRSVPSGWAEQQFNTTGYSGFLLTKPITNAGGEPASYTFTANTAPTGWAACIVAVSGRNTGAPVTASNVGTAGSGTGNVTVNTITAAAGDDLVLVYDSDSGSGTWGELSGFAERLDTSGLEVQTADGVSAGATGNKQGTCSVTTSNKKAFLIAIAAAAAGGGTVWAPSLTTLGVQ